MKELYLTMCAYLYPLWIVMNIVLVLGIIWFIFKCGKQGYTRFCDFWDSYVRRKK